jgi:predicted lactoylglutathione lyase
VATDTINLLKVNSDSNYEKMTEKQQEALKKLREKSDLVIKPADKGGSIVLMDRVDYETAINKMMEDQKFYSEVKEDLNPGFQEEVKKVVKEMTKSGAVSPKEAEHLINLEPHSPKFYGLPKVHEVFELIPSFRPIVSGCNSCCKKISNFMDFHLQ